jgi:hypothetical protein
VGTGSASQNATKLEELEHLPINLIAAEGRSGSISF